MFLKILMCLLTLSKINTSLRKSSLKFNSEDDDFGCYWSNHCPYQLFGTKTPYDSVRGDLRDFKKPQGCKAVSFWSLHRHGNRNPLKKGIKSLKNIACLKDPIIAAYDGGKSRLCAQDIDYFRKFVWNKTIEVALGDLTPIGYKELYDIGTRVKTAYPELLNGSPDDYYFRPTNMSRTITSAQAFVLGLTDGTNLDLKISKARKIENVIRPYKTCDSYQKLVYNASIISKEVKAFKRSSDYQAIKTAVQERIGIDHQINDTELFAFYELCRNFRAWDVSYRSPWCGVLTNEEVRILEYEEDIRHYYAFGYGSWMNPRLGGPPLKDLYNNFEAAVKGRGKKIVSYFTHDSMLEMVWTALGLYKDPKPLTGKHRNVSRLWRTSYMVSKAMNLMAVLNRCEESDDQVYRVQLFIGEKPTELCPIEGCTWKRFQEIFQPFKRANLDFCRMNSTKPQTPLKHDLDDILLLLS